MGFLMRKFLANFFESDYLERDPKRKFDVGLAHAFGGALLIMVFPMWLVLFGYIIKELVFDLSRVFMSKPSKWATRIWADRWLVADSVVDWSFWWLGATMVASGDARYGFAALIVGSAYFIVGKYND